MKGIQVLPAGSVDPGVLRSIAQDLERTFRIKTVVKPGMPVPGNSYDARRGQYHSAIILKEIQDNRQRDHLVLGVTEADLYASDLNFVFGEADVENGIAIISLARLRQEFYGLDPDKEVFRTRAVKEAIHEIGHLWGLDHCSNPKCIMYFSNSIRDTDRKGPDFCDRCTNILGVEP